MSRPWLGFSATLAILLTASSALKLNTVKLEPVEQYIVVLKPEKTVSAVEARIRSRTADMTTNFRANIDTRSMFRSNKYMQGFVVMTTGENAEYLRASDSDILMVEKDSVISTDDY